MRFPDKAACRCAGAHSGGQRPVSAHGVICPAPELLHGRNMSVTTICNRAGGCASGMVQQMVPVLEPELSGCWLQHPGCSSALTPRRARYMIYFSTTSTDFARYQPQPLLRDCFRMCVTFPGASNQTPHVQQSQAQACHAVFGCFPSLKIISGLFRVRFGSGGTACRPDSM